MSALHEIAEAKASALSLRASAKACGPEHGALAFRLRNAATSLDAMVLLAMRGLDRVEELEQELRQLKAALPGAYTLTVAGESIVDSADCELILRALDVLDLRMPLRRYIAPPHGLTTNLFTRCIEYDTMHHVRSPSD